MIKEGTVRFHVPDRYTLEVSENEHIELKFDQSLPINIRVLLNLDTHEYVVLPEQPLSSNTTRKHIAIYYLRKIDSDKEREIALAVVNEFVEAVYNFWTQFARDWWDIKVSGHLLDMETCPYGPYEYCTRQMKAAHRSLEDPPFDPNYWHIIGYSKTGACGQASLGGNAGATYGSNCTSKTSIHELGHNFGLMHAELLLEDGTTSEYDDKTSVMGGWNASGFMPINAHQAKLFREGEVLDINATEQVHIVPYEMDYPSRLPGERTIVRVHKDKEPFFVSLRKCDGTVNAAHRNFKNKLFIHRKKGVGSVRHAILDVGQEFVYENIRIQYIGLTGETAKVNVLYEDRKDIIDTPVKTGFPLIPDMGKLGIEYQGAWHDPDRIGQGIDVYYKDGRTTFAWYTYNTYNDSRRFYTATTMNGDDFLIYSTHDGTFDDPSKHVSRVVGSGQLYFLGPDKGVFNYDIEGVGRNTLRLSPVVRSVNPLDGFFWRPDRNGEGVSIHFLPDDRFVCYWYTYGPKKVEWGHTETPEQTTTQRWYTATGKLGEEVALNDVVGLRFMEFSRVLPIKRIGTIKVELKGQNWLNLYSTLGDVKMRRFL